MRLIRGLGLIFRERVGVERCWMGWDWMPGVEEWILYAGGP
jgi:hypothetical protein